MSLTTWIPLTDVSPLNGCMYLLPAHMDPKYAEGVVPTTEEVMQGVRAVARQLPGRYSFGINACCTGAAVHPEACSRSQSLSRFRVSAGRHPRL